MKQAAETKVCRTVSLDSVNFSKEVVENLLSDRVFSVTNLSPTLKIAIKQLFEAGNCFFDKVHTYDPEEFSSTIGTNNISGLFPPQKPLLMCNNAVRFYVSINKEGVVDNKKIPLHDGKPIIEEASKVFHRETDIILGRILQAIAEKLNLDVNELSTPILDGAMISLTRYYPITQKRAAQLFDKKVLSLNGDNVEQFSKHRDVCPITILVYQGGTRGLMVEDTKTKKMVPLSLESTEEASLIIFTGRILKELTGGCIPALTHQVFASPQEQHLEAQMSSHNWRFTLAKFTYLDKVELQPLKTLSGVQVKVDKERKHKRTYPVLQSTFFKEYLDNSDEFRAKTRASEFPIEIVQKYPTHVKDEELYVAQLGTESIGPYK